MTFEDNLEKIVQGRWLEQWDVTPRVNPQYDRVRRISETHVVKLPKIGINYWATRPESNKLWHLHKLCREFQMHKNVFDLGLSVPKSEGIYEVIIRDSISNRGANVPGLVMEYIPGTTLYNLLIANGIDFFKAERQRNEEIKKLEKLGFYNSDADNDSNAIWNSEKKKIYLIDFENCVAKE